MRRLYWLAVRRWHLTLAAAYLSMTAGIRAGKVKGTYSETELADVQRRLEDLRSKTETQLDHAGRCSERLARMQSGNPSLGGSSEHDYTPSRV